LLARVQQFSDDVLRATAAEAGVDVSNLEVFIRRFRTRVETGTGIRIEYPATRADAEICFIARFGDKVAEHTARLHARRFEDLNPEELARTNAGYARAIAQAGPPPQHQGPVVLSGEAAFDFMRLEQEPLMFHCSARTVHEKMSRYEKGKPAWGDKPLQGDAVTLFSDPLVPFGTGSRIETDATPTRRIALVEEGRYAELYGTPRFYHYLGLLEQGVKPTGLPGNTVVLAGKARAADLLGTERVVVVKTFSDFRADPTSGDFASEIRLGEVLENGEAVQFRGGLLIGNWFTALADIRLSQETMVMDDYYGPSTIRLGSLKVAG
jgi:predicted Zn-dependent protease